MSQEQLQHLLFWPGAVIEGKRLFASRQELAQKIFELRSLSTGTVTAEKAINSIASNLSQTFNLKRGASVKLREEIAKAVEKAVEQKANRRVNKNVLKQLDEAFEQLKSSKVLIEALNSDKQFDALQRRGDVAKTHFVMSFEPAETKSSSRARELTEVLLDRLKMRKPKRPSKRGNRNSLPQADQPDISRYVFCVSNEPAARKLLSAIYARSLEIDGDEGHAATALRTIDKSGRLLVLLVPPALCAVPTVVYDPDRPERAGFVVIYHANDGISVAEMSGEVLHHWHNEVYLQLKPGGQYHGAIRRIHWSDDLIANASELAF
jgi:hypothetical protein